MTLLIYQSYGKIRQNNNNNKNDKSMVTNGQGTLYEYAIITTRTTIVTNGQGTLYEYAIVTTRVTNGQGTLYEYAWGGLFPIIQQQ